MRLSRSNLVRSRTTWESVPQVRAECAFNYLFQLHALPVSPFLREIRQSGPQFVDQAAANSLSVRKPHRADFFTQPAGCCPKVGACDRVISLTQLGKTLQRFGYSHHVTCMYAQLE